MRQKYQRRKNDQTAGEVLPPNVRRLNDELNLAAGIRYRLGEMLLQAGRITLDKLEVAIAEQCRSGGKIGHILLKMGLDPGELNVALEFQRRQAVKETVVGPLRLGEMMIAAGLITRTQMVASLLRQKLTGKKLGEDMVAEGIVRPHQIANMLQLQHRMVSAALATALALGSFSMSSNTEANGYSPIESSKEIAVTRQVSLKVLDYLTDLTITAEDINRGYVEAPAALTAKINHNSPGGYMLVFENLGDFVHQTIVRGLGDEMQLDGKGGVVTQTLSATHTTETTVTMGFRFMLADHTRPGTYGWPMQMSVLPL